MQAAIKPFMSKSSAVVSFVATLYKSPHLGSVVEVDRRGAKGDCRHRRRAVGEHTKCDCDSGYFKNGRQQGVSVLATRAISSPLAREFAMPETFLQHLIQPKKIKRFNASSLTLGLAGPKQRACLLVISNSDR